MAVLSFLRFDGSLKSYGSCLWQILQFYDSLMAVYMEVYGKFKGHTYRALMFNGCNLHNGLANAAPAPNHLSSGHGQDRYGN